MPNSPTTTVLVDTTFLINLVNASSTHHNIAKQYHREFIRVGYEMKLSVIVIAEFQQKQPITDLVSSENYKILPYNYDDAIKTAEIAFNLSKTGRGLEGDDSRADAKDDVKLIGQAENNGITYIITADANTLASYCEKLNLANLVKVKAILLSTGFDSTLFNSGQTAML